MYICLPTLNKVALTYLTTYLLQLTLVFNSTVTFYGYGYASLFQEGNKQLNKIITRIKKMDP